MSINRLVGERVFGWSIKDGEPEQWRTLRITHLDCQYHETPVDSGPHFDREIAAAWEVVEHLENQSPMWLAKLVRRTGDLDHISFNKIAWACELRLICGKSPRVEAIGAHESAPMAICLAALRAVGVPEATIQEACK